MNTKIAILLVVVVLFIAALFARPEVPPKAGFTTYTDSENVFSFQYPEGFSLSGRDGPILARVVVPRGYMPGTNFSEAELTVSTSGPATDETCKTRNTTTEAAAGNLYETTTIEKIYDGDCYIFTYIIHSTNLGNYDPNQGIVSFDHAKVQNELEDIVESFKYLVDSN